MLIQNGFEIINQPHQYENRDIYTTKFISNKKSLLTECTEIYKTQVKNGEAILIKNFKNVRLFRFPESNFNFKIKD
jgi:hypothetical protein